MKVVSGVEAQVTIFPIEISLWFVDRDVNNFENFFFFSPFILVNGSNGDPGIPGVEILTP